MKVPALVLATLRPKWALAATGFAALVGVASSIYRVAHDRMESGRDEYADLTYDELYERARQADVRGRSKMNKRQLIAALAHE